jgi:hypothetical protein
MDLMHHLAKSLIWKIGQCDLLIERIGALFVLEHEHYVIQCIVIL